MFSVEDRNLGFRLDAKSGVDDVRLFDDVVFAFQAHIFSLWTIIPQVGVRGRLEETRGPVNQTCSILIGQRDLNPVISEYPLIVGIQEPPVELWIEHLSFGKMFAERRVDTPMLPKAQSLPNQQRFSSIQHCIVCPSHGEIRFSIFAEYLSGMNGSVGFIEQCPGGIAHAGIASSRTFARNGVWRSAQSCCETNTRLMLTPNCSEN